MEDLDFDDLAPIEVPIKVKGEIKYILKEASADVAMKYRNAAMRGSVIDTATKRITPGESAGAEVIAVAASLYEVYQHANEQKLRLMLLSTIQGWKNTVVMKLFDKLKEISPGLILSEESDNKAKKPQSEPLTNGSLSSGSLTS